MYKNILNLFFFQHKNIKYQKKYTLNFKNKNFKYIFFFNKFFNILGFVYNFFYIISKKQFSKFYKHTHRGIALILFSLLLGCKKGFKKFNLKNYLYLYYRSSLYSLLNIYS